MDNRKDSYKSIPEMNYYSQKSQKTNNISGNNGFDFKNNNIIKIVAIVLVSVLLVIGGIKVVGSITGNNNGGHILSSSRTLSPEECVEEFFDNIYRVFMGLNDIGSKKMSQYLKNNYPEIIVSYLPTEREIERQMEEAAEEFQSMLEDVQSMLEDEEDYEELITQMQQIDINILSKRELDAFELEDLAKDAEHELDETITFEKGWIIEGEMSAMGETSEMEFTVLQCNGKRAVWAVDGDYIWEDWF